MTRWLRAGWLRVGVICLLLVVCGGERLVSQAVSTTTVQGTVYLANGAPGTGTLLVSWPAFTTTVQIGADGFVSVNLAPNLGANPAGLYYTAVFHLSDGTVNTEYWVVPAAATASLAQVQAKLMPAAQAVQAVSKTYVDQAVAMNAPYFAVFGSDTTIADWNLYDLTINGAFIGAATKGGAYWRWERVNMNGVGIALLAGSSQLSTFRDPFIQNSMAGFVVGGWWGTRAPGTSPSGLLYLNVENLGDATTIDGVTFYGANWPTLSQSQIAQNALDTWFNTYFFHVGDNQTRLTDQNKAGQSVVPDSMWRGIYHVLFAMYSRYGRPTAGVQVHNANVKGTQNYPIVATAAIDWVIDGLGTEDVGYCNGNAANGNFGSTSCPSPNDSVNNALPGAILLYGFQSIYAKGIQLGGNPILEAVAEPQQVSAAQQLADFRAQLTNIGSVAASSVAPRVQPTQTNRLILSQSNSSFPPGVTNADSGELCLKGMNAGYPEEWCMRAEEQAYTNSFGAGSFTMPRYLALENDGYAANSGTAEVQMPGLRVRPGVISGSDGTLPITDFAEQAFAIASGTVLGETCATVPGISLPNAVYSDGVLFVKAPAGTGLLQLSGSITAAGTLR